jgi:hypothetical protein
VCNFRLDTNQTKNSLTEEYWSWLHSNTGLGPEIHPLGNVARKWGMTVQQKQSPKLQFCSRHSDHLPWL